MEIVHNTKEIISKKKFFKNFPPFWPDRVILTPKNALFEQIFADFCLFDDYNIEIILENHGGDCSQYSGDHFEIKIFPV